VTIPLLLNATQSAKYIGMGRNQFYAAVRTGKIKAVLAEGTKKYRRKDLETYVERLKDKR
jgi:ribosomal protein L30E